MSEPTSQIPVEPKPIPIRESWIKRNGLWFFPLLVFIVGVPTICCGSFMLGVGWFANLVAAPKEAAIAALEQDERITSVIGTNISGGNQMSASDFQINNGNGHGKIEFTASGSQGKANVKGMMRMTSGEWSVERLVVTFEDGTEITVPAETD